MADPTYVDDDGILTDPEAWVALASTTVSGSSTSSITFTAAAVAGTDKEWSQFVDFFIIQYVQSLRSDVSDSNYVYFNPSDAQSSKYMRQAIYTDGSNVVGVGNVQHQADGGGMVAYNSGTYNHVFSGMIWNIQDVNSGKFTSMHVQYASDRKGTSGYTGVNYVGYQMQQPVTEIKFDPEWANFTEGSRIDLFGILPRMVS